MKNTNRTKKSIKNIFFGLTFRISSIIFQFIIKTAIIWTLGAEYLGLNSLFNSILVMLSLSELGIGSALVYNMYKPITEKDDKKVCALLNTYKICYRIIGIVILIIGILILPFLKYFINGEIPNGINIYLLFIIYLINTVSSYLLFAYKNAILEATQNNGIENLIKTLINIFMYLLQILFLFTTHNYYLYIIIMPIATIVLNLVRSKKVDEMYPQYKCSGKLKKEEIKNIFKKTGSLIGHKIGTSIITSADSIVISAILGLEVLAIYSNYYLIITSLITFVTIFYTSITAGIGDSIIQDEPKKVEKNFNTLVFVNNWIVGFCTICLLCLYQPFMKLWMGKEMMFNFNIVILFSIYFYTWIIRRIGLTYKDAAGLWEPDFWKPYIGIVVNLITNIILVNLIGVAGATLSTIIIMVVIYFPWETAVIYKYIFKSSPKRYITKITIFTILTIFLAALTYYLTTLISIEGIIGLALKAIICVIIPNSFYFIIFRKSKEFADIKKRFKLIKKERVS